MIIAEYKRIDTKTATNTIMVDDYDPETGEVIGQHEETVTKEIPVMGMVYRDSTPEEIAESERMARSMPMPEPTIEDKVNALMQYMGLRGRWNGSVFEVVKSEMGSGDYTNPIRWTPGIFVEVGKWYYTDDKDLPHEALGSGTPVDFNDRAWFDYI